MKRTRVCLLSLALVSLFAHAADSSLQFGGDFRFRTDWINSKGSTTGFRQSAALRAGGKATVNEEIDFTLRFGTGNARTSTFQLLGENSSQGYTVRVDQAYATYRPIAAFRFLAGRTPKLFHNPGDTGWLLDNDLNLDGVTAQVAPAGESFTPSVTVGHYYVNKATTGNVDTRLLSAELGSKLKGESMGLDLSVGYYHYMKSSGAPVVAAASGNTTLTSLAGATVYRYGFRVFTPGFEVTMPVAGAPFGFYGSWATNLATKDSYDWGYIAGLHWGEKGKKGKFYASYNFREVRRDVSLGAFAESDWFGGGTDVRGHAARVAYGLMDKLSVTLSGASGFQKINTSKGRHNRVMFDFGLTF